MSDECTSHFALRKKQKYILHYFKALRNKTPV